ncbi:MAG: hypothetical protein HOQ05_10305 [Corynebacteriales bacterium]|nr:hypothetical protein [Mycobacteriales bacterium]
MDKNAFFAGLKRRVIENGSEEPRDTVAEFLRLYIETFAETVDAETTANMSRAVRAGLGLVSANTTAPRMPRKQSIPPVDAGPDQVVQPRTTQRQRNPNFDELPRHIFDEERDQSYPHFLEAFVRHLYVHRISEDRLAAAMDVNHKTARALTANIHDPESETVALACRAVGFSASESEAVAAGALRYRARFAEFAKDAAQHKMFFPIRPPRHRQLRDTDEARFLLRQHIWENYNHDSEFARKARVKYQYVGRFLLGTRRCTTRDVTEMFQTAGAEPEFLAEVLEVLRNEGWLTGTGVRISGDTLTASADQHLREFTAEYRKLYAQDVTKAELDDVFARRLDELFHTQIQQELSDEVAGSILIGRRRVPRFPEFHEPLNDIEPFRVALPSYLQQNDLSIYQFCVSAGIGIDSYNGFAHGDGLWTAPVLDRVLDVLRVDDRTRAVVTEALSEMDATRVRHNQREYHGTLDNAEPLARTKPYALLTEIFQDAEAWERRNNLAPGTLARAIRCPERNFPKYRKGTMTPTLATVRELLEILAPPQQRQREVIELAATTQPTRAASEVIEPHEGPVWEYLPPGQEEALIAGASEWVSVYLTTVAHELKADSEFGRGLTVAEEARRIGRMRAMNVARPESVRWILSEYTASGLDDIRELSATQQKQRERAINERRRHLASSQQLDVDPIVLAGEDLNLPPGVPMNFELLTVDGVYWLLDVAGGKATQIAHFDTLAAAGNWVSHVVEHGAIPEPARVSKQATPLESVSTESRDEQQMTTEVDLPPTPNGAVADNDDGHAADMAWAAALADLLEHHPPRDEPANQPRTSTGIDTVLPTPGPRAMVSTYDGPDGTAVGASTEASLIVSSDSRVIVCLTTVPPEMMSPMEFSPIATKGWQALPAEQRHALQDRRIKRQEAEEIAPRTSLTCLMTEELRQGVDREYEGNEVFQRHRKNEIRAWQRRAGVEVTPLKPQPSTLEEPIPGCFELLHVGDEEIVVGLDNHVPYRVTDPAVATACVEFVKRHAAEPQVNGPSPKPSEPITAHRNEVHSPGPSIREDVSRPRRRGGR